MILPDSSVWIDWLGNSATPTAQLLGELLARRFVVGVGDLMLAEVLQGTRTAKHLDVVKNTLQAFPLIGMVGGDVAMAAAINYQTLRTRGVTPRKTIDTLIATRCILDRIPLLYSDRDFDPFVQHLGLRSAMDLDTGVS